MDRRPSSFAIGYFLVGLTDIRLEKAAVLSTWEWAWVFVDADSVLQVTSACFENAVASG
jgi:hypothetical protein